MNDPVSGLLATFGASGPDPALSGRLTLFGQFVGSWDLLVTDHDGQGGSTSSPGEWHFGWALAGRAVADVWICPRRSASGVSPGKHGLSMRFPESSIGAWRSIWIEPRQGVVRQFIARPQDGGEILLSGRFDDSLEMRWIFSEITPHSFRWRNEQSLNGRDWQLRQSFEATRA
jgi:hypothetical protein